ncbi:hypothetical protein ACFYV5_14755 [Streptomyces sp. NPDC003035]|uniref:hypothetical protein n=1 Tax=Streptomyces sp. NPDC003035 TaxID=3364676 RepID=UPI0036896A68
MSEELRRRLLSAREIKERRRIEQHLATAGLAAYFEEFVPPRWTVEERSRFYRSDTRASFSTPLTTPEELGHWIERIVTEQGMSAPLMAATNLENFPWIKLRHLEMGWGVTLMETLGKNLTLLSQGSGRLLVFFEEEYEYVAFVASTPAT